MDPVEEPSLRKPVGALAICALALTWCVLVASLSRIVGGWPGWVQPIFYLVTGIVWIAPMKPLLRWMETGRWQSEPKRKEYEGEA